MISIVLVDDQALVRMGLRALLDSEPDLEVVAEGGDGDQALRLARQHRPNVVLMDIRMPGTDGLSALRAIVADDALPATKVVMLTTFELDEYVFAALEAGASGFMIKDAEPDDIIRAVRAAAAGEGLLSPTVTRRVITQFAGGAASRRTKPHPGLTQLTEREHEVLTLIAQGLNNEEIAARLVISKATARTHVGNILGKLQARDRAQLVVIAYQSGLA